MPMMFHSQEDHSEENHAPQIAAQNTQAPAQERRYDPETLQKVAILATRLQQEHHEQPASPAQLTASDMEAIGLEMGLHPEFVQQALAQLEEEHARMEVEKQRQEAVKQKQQEQIAEQRRLREQTTLHKTALQTELAAGNAEFYSACAALAIPFAFGFLAWHFKSTHWMGGLLTDGYSHPMMVTRPGMLAGFTMIAPAPLALMLGFLAGKKRVAFAASAAMMLALAPTFPFLVETGQTYFSILRNLFDYTGEMFGYVFFGLPVVGLMAITGAWARKTYFPFGGRQRDNADVNSVQHKEYAAPKIAPAPQLQPMSYAQGAQAQSYAAQSNTAAQPYQAAQPYMPGQAYGQTPQYAPPPMQTPYTGQAQHPGQAYAQRPEQTHAPMQTTPMYHQNRRAVLSLEVADKDKLRQSATLVAVDYSFGQFRSWVEELVRGCGGEMQTGVNLTATFPTDAQAMRAARLLQERLPQFNQSLNRLPLPFLLRAAVSAGDANSSLASQRNAALLRNANPGDTLVSSEVGAAALAELGQLTPLPASLMGEMAFVWRAEKQG